MRDKLSALKVSTLKKVGAYADGGGLYLRITRPGYKLWTAICSPGEPGR